MRHQYRDIILSIHPRHVENIMRRIKTVELRRVFPGELKKPNPVAHIYSTAPISAIVGCVNVKRIIKAPVQKIWESYGVQTAIDEAQFKGYFKDKKHGYAIFLGNPRLYELAFHLRMLREELSFRPPQSFCYAPDALSRILNNKRTRRSDLF